MIYIVEGDEELFVLNKLKELVKDFDNAIKIDCNRKDFSNYEILDSLSGNSLFSDINYILVKDPPFLCKKIEDDSVNSLLEYCKNPIFENELIFYTLENKFDSRLKVYKKISENAQVIVCNALNYNNFDIYLKEQLNIYKIKLNNDCFKYLSNICKRNATILKQNLIILSNYPDQINLEVLEKLCTAYDDDKAFELVNAIISNNISEAIRLERIMFNDTDSLISIIGLLASQLRFLYQFSYMLEKNYNKKEILDELKINDYRYNKTLQLSRKTNSNNIMYLLNQLSNFDIKVKNDNSLSDKERLELFIIKLIK